MWHEDDFSCFLIDQQKDKSIRDCIQIRAQKYNTCKNSHDSVWIMVPDEYHFVANWIRKRWYVEDTKQSHVDDNHLDQTSILHWDGTVVNIFSIHRYKWNIRLRSSQPINYLLDLSISHRNLLQSIMVQ